MSIAEQIEKDYIQAYKAKDQAQSAEAHLILGLVSLNIVLFDLFSDAHDSLPVLRKRTGRAPDHDGKAAKF